MNAHKKKLFALMTATSLSVGAVPMPVYASNTDELKEQKMEVEDALAKAKQSLEASKVALEKAKKDHDLQAQVVREQLIQLKQQEVAILDDLTKAIDEKVALMEASSQELGNHQTAMDNLAKKMEATQKEWDTCQTKQVELEKQLAQAKVEADKITPEDLTQAKQAVEVYEATYKQAKANVEEAKIKVTEANEALDVAKENEKKATSKHAQAQETYNQATSAVNAAQQKVDDAKSVLEAVKDPEKVAQANGELKAATTALETAQAELVTAKTAYDKANETLTQATIKRDEQATKVEALNADLTIKQQAYTKADQAYQTAHNAYTSANEALKQLNQELAQLESDKNTKQQAYDQRVADENVKKVAHEKAVEEVRQKQAELDALGGQGGSTEAQKLDSLAFFEAQNATQAVDYLQAPQAKKYTQIGTTGDATDLDFMEDCLAYVRKCNDIRKGLGLSELKITHEAMAASQVQTNHSAGHLKDTNQLAHSQIFNYAENLAVCRNDLETAFRLWYDEEKKIFDEFAIKNPDIIGMSAYQVSQKYPEIYHQVGHYLNIIDKDYTVTGFSINNHYVNGYRSPVLGQVFGWGGGKAYTVDEYEKLYTDYINQRPNPNEAYEAALAALNAAKAAEATAKSNYDTAKGATQEAKTTLDQALNLYRAKAEAVNKAQAQLPALQQALNDTASVKDAAKAALDAVKGEVDTATAVLMTLQGEVTVASETKAQKEAIYTQKQTAHDNAKATYDRKKAVVDAIAQGEAAAQAALSNAKQQLQAATQQQTSAKQAKDKAAEELKVATEAVVAKQTLVTQAEKDLQTKTKVASGAKTAYDEAVMALDHLQTTLAKVEELEEALAACKVQGMTLNKSLQDLQKAMEDTNIKSQEAKKSLDGYTDSKDRLEAYMAAFVKLKEATDPSMMTLSLPTATNDQEKDIESKIRAYYDAKIALFDAQAKEQALGVLVGEKEKAYKQAKDHYDHLMTSKDEKKDTVSPPATGDTTSTLYGVLLATSVVGFALLKGQRKKES